jgi:SecD/SecF fusion protein
MSPYVNAFIVLVLMVVPFFLGGYFAKSLRMPDYGWKIGVILWTLICSLVILTMYWPPKLGIDLSGGMILIYEIDKNQLKPGTTPDMDKVIAAINKRINPGGVKEIPIRKYGADGVEIIIPDVDEAAANRVAQLVSQVGTLEFRILANTTDNKTLIERAKSEPNQNVILDSEGNREVWWVPIYEGQDATFLRSTDIAVRTRTIGNKKVNEVLVLQDNYNVTGDFLDHAGQGQDQSGRIAVEFVFNSQGGKLFGYLTGENKPDEVTGFQRRLGIILDGKLFSAPGLKGQIFDRGIIEGEFTKEQVTQQVDVLNAGALPATLNKDPISKLYCGPTLGKDTIFKSTIALTIAMILVPAFMLWYYRFPGIIADIALALNIIVLLAIMIAVKAAFTLPGFAGFALTVGMAVDNNVLVFERLREELARGAALRMAIRNAFQRASATIIDCNITHLIAAVVLYAIAPEQVKGFAVTLFLGVSISMFTSVFVARVIFDIAEKHRWITQLKMHHLIGHTEIDFMGWFPYCLTFSVLITVLGLVVAFWRGPGLFDIDFTGGTSVQTLFNKPQDVADIRNTLEKMPDMFPDVTISDVRLGDEIKDLRFEVNTSNTNINQVKEELKKVFAGKLFVNEMEIKEISPIGAAKPEKEPPKEETSREKPAEKIEPAAIPAEPPAVPAKPDESGQKKQSRRILRSRSLMAMATAIPLIFGQVEAPAAVPPAAASSEQAKPSSQPAGEKPAQASQPNNTPAASKEKPEEKPPLAEPPAEKKPGQEKPAEKMPAEETISGEEKTAAQIADLFSGGAEGQISFTQKIDHQSVEDLLKEALQDLKIEEKNIPLDIKPTGKTFEEGSKTPYQDWTVKIGLPPEKAEAVFNSVKQKLGEAPYFPASNTIGGAVAVNTRYQAIYALLASWVLIILYLWIRFQGVAFGLAAVIALVHDVLVMLGAIAFSYYLAPYFGWLYIDPFKINLPIIAAFLTIIGYSVNDTIVVFDRIREVRGKDPNMTAEMVNLSTNQTLSRTLLTSLTVFMVVVVLYFFAGQALRGLSFALIVGVITGTYSSIYVAAPILLWLIGKGKPT